MAGQLGKGEGGAHVGVVSVFVVVCVYTLVIDDGGDRKLVKQVYKWKG